MAASQPSTLNIVNNNAYMRLTGAGIYNLDSTNAYINSHNYLQIQSDNNTLIRTTNGNTTINNALGVITIDAQSNASNTLILTASNANGGIYMSSGSNGITQQTQNGPINITSYGSNINLGNTGGTGGTQNIQIECNQTTYLGSDTVVLHATDLIQIFSDTGNIEIGTDATHPLIRFENGNFLINQAHSDLDYQNDIYISKSSNSTTVNGINTYKPGYNGIAINTGNTSVAAEINIVASTSNGQIGSNTIIEASLSTGTQPANSNYAIYQTYMGYVVEDNNDPPRGNIVRVDGPEFNYNDIGRTLVWSNINRTDIITDLNALLIAGIDTVIGSTPTSSANIAVSFASDAGYTGNSSALYIIEIDGVVNNTNSNLTFRWSDNGGNTYNAELIPIPFNRQTILLNNNIQIAFNDPKTITYKYMQQFTFSIEITAVVSNSTIISQPQLINSIQPYYSYIKTDTPTDIVISTNNTEKMRITGDGAISLQTTQPTAGFEINSKYGDTLLVNENANGYQLNSCISALTTGGYMVTWQSSNVDTSAYIALYGDIWAQKYMTDGSRYGVPWRVNTVASSSSNNLVNIFPACAGNRNAQLNGISGGSASNFVIVWANRSVVGGPYSIYAQVYDGRDPSNKLRSSDILIAQPPSSSGPPQITYLYPQVTSTNFGNYVIVWDASGNIYARTLSDDGGTLGPIIQIDANDTPTPGYSLTNSHPRITGLSGSDPTYPNGIVISYLSYDSSTQPGQQMIKFVCFNISQSDGSILNPSGANIVTIIGTNPTYIRYSDGLNGIDYISSGGFVLSTYENYIIDADFYTNPNTITSLADGVSTGVISSHSVSSGVYTLTVALNPGSFFSAEQEFYITDTTNDNTLTQRIASITYSNATTANIVIDSGHHSITAYAFQSNATSSISTGMTGIIWGPITVNNSRLYDDPDRLNSTSGPTDPSIYAYIQPTAQISINDTGSCMVAWTSGTIPLIYYRILSSSDGTYISDEALVSTKNMGTKHRNHSLTWLSSIQGNDYGHVISWDNQNYDNANTGVYHTLIGYNHYIIKAMDSANTSQLNMTHTGKLGLGIAQPTDTLHIKSASINNTNITNDDGIQIIASQDIKTGTALRIQNNNTILKTSGATVSDIIDINNPTSAINFADGNNNIIGAINSTTSPLYNGLFPYTNDIMLMYDFNIDRTDNIDADTIVPDRSPNNINGYLMGFDLENCWQPGLINDCLVFNGSGYINCPYSANSLPATYIFTPQTASLSTYNNFGSGCGSIAAWIYVPSGTLIENGQYTIISTSTTDGIYQSNGAYQFYVAYDGSSSNIALYFSVGVTPPIKSTIDIPLDSWCHVGVAINKISSSTYINLYINGVSSPQTTLSSTYLYAYENLNMNIGALDCGTSGPGGAHGIIYKFVGRINQIKLWSTALATSDFLALYNYGISAISGNPNNTLILSAIPTLLTNQTPYLADNNAFNNMCLSSADFKVLIDYTITGYRGNVVITGTPSANDNIFASYIKPGDVIAFGSAEYTVMQILDNSNIVIDRPPNTGVSSSASWSNPIIKPAMISYISTNVDLSAINSVGIINYDGKCVIGNDQTSGYKLCIEGTPQTANRTDLNMITNNDIPYIALINGLNSNMVPTTGAIMNALESRQSGLSFQGYDINGVKHELAALHVTHYDYSLSSIDNYVGAIKFKVNNGNNIPLNNELQTVMIVAGSNSNVGAGFVGINTSTPREQLNINNSNGAASLLLTSSYSCGSSQTDSQVYASTSQIGFGVNQGDNGLINTSISAIRGSRAEGNTNMFGRIDIATNNTADSINLVNQMSIDNVGNVGINMEAPVATLQVAPRFSDAPYGIYNVKQITYNTSNVIINVTGSIPLSSALISGYVVITDRDVNLSQVQYNIQSIDPIGMNITISRPSSLFTDSSGQTLALYAYGALTYIINSVSDGDRSTTIGVVSTGSNFSNVIINGYVVINNVNLDKYYISNVDIDEQTITVASNGNLLSSLSHGNTLNIHYAGLSVWDDGSVSIGDDVGLGGMSGNVLYVNDSGGGGIYCENAITSNLEITTLAAFRTQGINNNDSKDTTIHADGLSYMIIANVDAVSSNITVDISGANAKGQQLIIKALGTKLGTYNINITSGTGTIDGSGTYGPIVTQYQVVRLICAYSSSTGGNIWYII